MVAFEQIPRKWVNAYLLIISWYAIHYSISTIAEYQIFNPTTYVLWNGLYMYEILCILIFLTFLWANFLFKYHLGIQILGHLIGLALNFFLMGSAAYFLESYLEGDVYFEDWVLYLRQLLSWEMLRFHDQYIITVFIYQIIKYIESLTIKEREKTELAVKNKEMELSLLKSQINPHFLFNTLNSISTLIHFNKDKARKMITQLSEIFRYAMDSYGNQLVDLERELKFVDNYIKIQKVRFEERLNYVKEIHPDCMNVKIPPMILQPMVENAVKYGIGPKDEGGTIKLVIKPIVGGGTYFEVSDDGLGVNATKVLDGSSSGIGIKNSDTRLRNFFGPISGLKVKATEQGYKVSFVILKQKITVNGNQMLSN